MIKKNKQHHVFDSKTFCMFPWLHLNVTPRGDIYPCCSQDYKHPIGNTKTITLEKAFNLDKMKELRLDMLNGIPNSTCNFCYEHEKSSPYSFRKYANQHFGKYFDDIVPRTLDDGTVDEFKMRYFDIRFSNLCNFKCRTCGAEFSSKWAEEQKKNNKMTQVLKHATDGDPKLLNEVLTHLDHTDIAYFAGGEPLITEEHYIIVEELIRRGKTDITLRYNTNASHLQYKDHDILDLWKHFKKVEVSCSIDHYGDRAEWLRHGTDWSKIEQNLIKLRNINYIDFQLNTVLSIFNVLTLDNLFEYLIEKDILRHDDWHHTLYLAIHPPYYSAKALPAALKKIASVKLENFVNTYKHFPGLVQNVNSALQFIADSDLWEQNQTEFSHRTRDIDTLRNENFSKTFPELTTLID